MHSLPCQRPRETGEIQDRSGRSYIKACAINLLERTEVTRWVAQTATAWTARDIKKLKS